jgi:hypothetical protein
MQQNLGGGYWSITAEATSLSSTTNTGYNFSFGQSQTNSLLNTYICQDCELVAVGTQLAPQDFANPEALISRTNFDCGRFTNMLRRELADDACVPP